MAPPAASTTVPETGKQQPVPANDPKPPVDQPQATPGNQSKTSPLPVSVPAHPNTAPRPLESMPAPSSRDKAVPANSGTPVFTGTGIADAPKAVIAGTSVPQPPASTSANLKETAPIRDAPAPMAAQRDSAPAATTPAKEVVVRLQGQSGETISVRLVDQGGQVQVAVRSSDPLTATALRQDLSSLTNGLERAGWRSELVTPTVGVSEPLREPAQSSGGDAHDAPGRSALDWQSDDSSRKRANTSDIWDEILTRENT